MLLRVSWREKQGRIGGQLTNQTLGAREQRSRSFRFDVCLVGMASKTCRLWWQRLELTSSAAADLTNLRDIGALAAWSVSSSKPGFGVEHLSNPDTRTLWQ